MSTPLTSGSFHLLKGSQCITHLFAPDVVGEDSGSCHGEMTGGSELNMSPLLSLHPYGGLLLGLSPSLLDRPHSTPPHPIPVSSTL